jgi:methionine synthase II (cobalamin-independent)
MKMEPDALLDESIKADNACLLAARRPGLVRAMHLCRGNNRSHWYAEGGYDAIAEKLFGGMRADRFLLEYDDERSGTFEPLRHVPDDRIVVLGLVSSKKPQLESQVVLLKDGKQVFATKVSPLNVGEEPDWKHIPAAGRLRLGDELVPGEYVLQVIVTDKLAKEQSRWATQWMDFEVVK